MTQKGANDSFSLFHTDSAVHKLAGCARHARAPATSQDHPHTYAARGKGSAIVVSDRHCASTASQQSDTWAIAIGHHRHSASRETKNGSPPPPLEDS